MRESDAVFWTIFVILNLLFVVWWMSTMSKIAGALHAIAKLLHKQDRERHEKWETAERDD